MSYTLAPFDRIEKPPESSTSPRRKGTLLIVDDEEGPRQSLRVIFKDDYEILMASDGPSAIDLAQTNRIDVAVLDIRMAGMSGIEVLERLKYVDPSIEVVMMTAFETTETMRQALRLRACDYINKPFDISTMRAAVGGAMERRSLENEIHTNQEKLQNLLTELQSQKIEDQMSHTRGEIYASIIHDINGPLTVISGYIQLMNQRIGDATRLEPEDVDFIKDRLKTLTRQITNCIEISRRYLSFLRRPSDDIPCVKINQLLGDLTHLVRVHPSKQSNTFSIQPLPEDVSVRINGTDVIQLLLNLVVNAFQSTAESHTVEITSRILNQPLDSIILVDDEENRFINREGFENKGPFLLLSVQDNGPGIPRDLLNRIFEPYFTTKGPKQGTGLGLSIVLRLIKQAKGLLHVHSSASKGTSFTVYFQAYPTAAAV